MALQEMSLRDAMSQLENLYQQAGGDSSQKILLRVLPGGAPPQVGPPLSGVDTSAMNMNPSHRELARGERRGGGGEGQLETPAARAPYPSATHDDPNKFPAPSYPRGDYSSSTVAQSPSAPPPGWPPAAVPPQPSPAAPTEMSYNNQPPSQSFRNNATNELSSYHHQQQLGENGLLPGGYQSHHHREVSQERDGRPVSPIRPAANSQQTTVQRPQSRSPNRNRGGGSPTRRGSPTRGGGRSSSPPNPNQWKLNYQVPRDAYGRYSPEKDRDYSSPTRGGRSQSPPQQRAQPAGAQSTAASARVPRYRYNPKDLTLSGPLSPPSPSAAAERVDDRINNNSAPSLVNVERQPLMATSSSQMPPLVYSGDPRHRSILSPSTSQRDHPPAVMGDSLAARSARAHGMVPETWTIQPKKSVVRRRDPSPPSHSDHHHHDISLPGGESGYISPNRNRSESPTRRRTGPPGGQPVHVVSSTHPHERAYQQQQQAAYSSQAVAPQHQFSDREDIISPPRPRSARATPHRSASGGSYAGQQQMRNKSPKSGRSTPNRSAFARTTPSKTAVTSTPGRTTTPKRSHRYDHVQSKIKRVPQGPSDKNRNVSPRRQQVNPFFAANSQPHHQYSTAQTQIGGGPAGSMSPPRASSSRKGISWTVPS